MGLALQSGLPGVCSWLAWPQPRLLCSLLLSRFPSVPSAFHATLCCCGSFVSMPSLPTSCLFAHLSPYSSSRFLLSIYYVPGTVFGGRDTEVKERWWRTWGISRGGETEKGTVGSSIGICAVEGKWRHWTHIFWNSTPLIAISNASHAIKPSLNPQPEVPVPFSVPWALSTLLHSFTYKYLMSVDSIPGTILGTGDIAANNTDKSRSCSFPRELE